MKKEKMLKMMLAGCLLWCGCARQEETAQELEKYTNLSVDAGFDTVYQQTEYGYDHNAMAARFNTAVDMFSMYNELFDIYNEYEGINNLKIINDNAGTAPVEVDDEIIRMLKTAKYFHDISGGAFDVTIGNLLHVWHEYREEGIELNEEGIKAPVPSAEELKAAAVHCGWDKVIIDEENSTVFITDPQVSLDVGGIAKGYAAERIGEFMDGEDVVYATVNAGRNIRTVNAKTNGKPWIIGIMDPSDGSTFCTVEMDGTGSFVTSGDYERYYIGEDDGIYHHIIDPDTLYPASLYHSVSIITPDSAAADCLSTTLFTLTIAEGKKVLETYRTQSGESAEAVWIMDPSLTQDEEGFAVKDYYVVYTDGIGGRISWEQ